MVEKLIGIILSFLIIGPIWGQNQAKDVCGNWFTGNEMAIVKIFPNENASFTGNFVWLKDSIETNRTKKNYGQPVLDEFTGLPLLGTAIVRDLRYNGNEWIGIIYNPLSGKKVACIIKLSDDKDTLHLRGFIAVKWLGKTVKWKRYKCNFHKNVLR